MHEKVSQLEHLNKLYRGLAREGRTDLAGTLKDHVLTTNKRWDSLSGRIAAILRRLKHILNIRDDYDAAREALLVWFAKSDVELGRLYKKGRKETPAKLCKVKVRSVVRCRGEHLAVDCERTGFVKILFFVKSGIKCCLNANMLK